MARRLKTLALRANLSPILQRLLEDGVSAGKWQQVNTILVTASRQWQGKKAGMNKSVK
jgi:hypothetical protein